VGFDTGLPLGFGFGPGFFLAGLGSLSSLESTSELGFTVRSFGFGPGFYLAGAARSASEMSEVTSDFRLVDRVLRTGTAIEAGSSSSSEGGSIGVGEEGNSSAGSEVDSEGV
jgi:hypothetical protein